MAKLSNMSLFYFCKEFYFQGFFFCKVITKMLSLLSKKKNYHCKRFFFEGKNNFFQYHFRVFLIKYSGGEKHPHPPKWLLFLPSGQTYLFPSKHLNFPSFYYGFLSVYFLTLNLSLGCRPEDALFLQLT